ncbi:ABC transporter substrate-binding protein, partial [Aeromonas sp. HMWF036]
VLLHQAGLYIVFSKGTDDAEITRWQHALEAVRAAQGRADEPTREE